jgi:hypothetical protein
VKYLFPTGMLLIAGVAFALTFGNLDLPWGESSGRTQTMIPEYTLADILAIQAEAESLNHICQRAFRFHRTLEETKVELWAERLSLAKAADRVIAAAERDSPRFLRALANRFPGISIREKVALVLLGHLTARKVGSAEQASVPEALRCELVSWPGVHPTLFAYLDGDERPMATISGASPPAESH